MGIPFLIFLRKTSLKMKFLVIAALISLAASTSVGRNQQWDDFKVKFNKGFRDLKHESERRAVFEANLDTIEAHNVKYEKGLSSYKMGINQFTDMTYEEFSNIVLMDPRDSEHVEVMQSKKIESSAPDAWDWRDEGILNPVKDQASCGSCWAFSTLGSTEAAWARAGNDLVSLSEQMFIDCGAGDCNGGWVDRAFDTLLAQGGDCLETDYPYTARNGNGCKLDKSKIVASISGFFDDESCPKFSYNHAVVNVGYSTSEGYWTIRNSWASSWGEDGHIRIKSGSNICNCEKYAWYPEL